MRTSKVLDVPGLVGDEVMPARFMCAGNSAPAGQDPAGAEAGLSVR